MGIIVRGIAAGIGFAREKYENSKERRDSEKDQLSETTVRQVSRTSSAEKTVTLDDQKDVCITTEAVDKDEKVVEGPYEKLATVDSKDDAPPAYGEWELDEAQDEITGEQAIVSEQAIKVAKGVVPQKDIPYLAERFSQAYPLPSNESPLPELGCSVILCQRRPNYRKRGFVRAYAPVLATKGIDEECFLDFVETFNTASQANPLLHAINLAQFSAHALSPAIGTAVAEAIRLAVDTGVELQSRYRTNDFVDKINKEFFRPRGLCCFVMIWKPSVLSFVTNVTLDSTAVEQDEGERGFLGNFQGGASTSYGNVRFPDAAPLVFPILDQVADSQDKEALTWKAKMAQSMSVTNDYFDRRAQATYAMKNPHSELSRLGAKPEFKSRYADPSHPAASGSLLGLVTGGALSTAGWRRQRRQYRRERMGLVLGGTLINKDGRPEPGRNYADVMANFKLSNVIKTMRGKVSCL